MQITEYAYIFDYSTSSIYEVEIDKTTTTMDTEELLDYFGLNIDTCYVMFTTERKEIETLTKN